MKPFIVADMKNSPLLSQEPELSAEELAVRLLRTLGYTLIKSVHRTCPYTKEQLDAMSPGCRYEATHDMNGGPAYD